MRPAPFFLLALTAACTRPRSEVTPDPISAPAARPAYSDVTLASSTAETPVPEGGVKVFVGKRALALEDGKPLLQTGKDPAHGYPEEGKKNGLLLVPLADKLPKDPRALLYVDHTTTYRMLFEVVYTLAQKDFRDFVLVARNGSRDVGLGIKVPEAGVMAPTALHRLTLVRVADGVSVRTEMGNLLPGCKTLGVGVAVPDQAGAIDAAGLSACVKSVKAVGSWADTMTFLALAERPFSELVTVVDLVRPEFPNFVLAIPR